MVEGIRERIVKIRERIAEAAKRAGREPSNVKLMGVSKYQPLAAMKEAAPLVDLLGENRVQEALEKHIACPVHSVRWHLIGHLQMNKARRALEIFDLIESVDSADLAYTLNRIAGEKNIASLPIFLEVNMSGEASKNGLKPADVCKTAYEIVKTCGRLRIEGLMTIGPLHGDIGDTRRAFAGLRKLSAKARGETGLALPDLSMGMSGDYETAVEEGSTIVRIGTGIFGDRVYPHV